MAIITDSQVGQLAKNIESATLNGTGRGHKKPYLLFLAAPVSGHTLPLITIASHLIERGFEASFVTSHEFNNGITQIGAKHIEIPPMFSKEINLVRDLVPAGIPRILWDFKHVFLGQIPSRFQLVKEFLECFYNEEPSREIIIINETCFLGVLPFMYGASPPEGFAKFPKVININAIPMLLSSIDTGPFGPGLPPDATPSGRARNQLLIQMMTAGPFAESISYQAEVLKSVGATEFPNIMPPDTWMTSYDVTIQLCTPSLEYQRSDLHPSIKFASCLPPPPRKSGFQKPQWWDDLQSTKKVVVVSQGTVAIEYTDLLIPTIKALADRDDILLIAILGKRDASLPNSLPIPANTLVIDYLPYDDILPYADVFVMNAGWGGFLHGVMNGVPMVLGGATEDKPEVAMRGECSGAAINLRTGQPKTEDILQAINTLLSDDRYKTRVVEIQQENQAIDSLGFIEKQIWDSAC